MRSKTSQTFIAIIVLIQSTSLSSADKTMLNVITDSSGHQSLVQAVTEIIRSLEGDTPSAVSVIKVTSHEEADDGKNIDLFTETIVGSFHGLFEFHIQNYEKMSAVQSQIAFLIVSKKIASISAKLEKIFLPFHPEIHKKVLVILPDGAFPSGIKLMLEIMWRKFILNVHVVLQEESGDVSLNTYFPFTKDFCGQVHPVVWNIYRNGAFVTQREIFPHKTRNFFRCSLNVAVFNAAPYMIIRNESGTIDVDGVDGNVLETLSSELNFTINYVVVSDDVRWGEIYANQSATGATELVLNGSAHFSLGMFSKTRRRVEILKYSITYAQSPLILIVPPGSEFSSFEKLLSPFDDETWYIVNSMMLLIVVIVLILKCQRRKVQDFVFGTKIQTPLLNVVSIVVGLPTYKNPGRNFARWLLIMFILMWLIFRTIYQAELFKILQSTKRNMPVETIEETIQKNFKYYMIAPTHENIVNLTEVYNRRVIVSANDSISIISQFNDPSLRAAFLGALDTARYANKVKLYGFPLNVCREPLLLRHYGIIFPKKSFLDSTFDDTLLGLVENGLLEMWLVNLTEKTTYPISRIPMKLNLNHLLSAFQLFWLCTTLAFIAFAIELISLRMKCLEKLLRILE